MLNTTYLGSATLCTKLGTTMNKHNVLKNNNNLKEHQFIKYFICGQNY